MFTNEYLSQGALDLFDVQACFDDAWEAAQVIHPELLSHFRASVLQGTWDESAFNNVQGSYNVQDLFRGLVHLPTIVDRNIHYSQMCVFSKGISLL